MDDVDRRIMREVQRQPTISMSDLAEAVGLSQTPCWRRLRALEQEGVVRRAAILDRRALGMGVDVFAQVKIGRHDETTLNAFETEVLTHPEIVECFSMSGESDYMMRVVVTSIEHYERFLKKVLLHLPGVAAVNSSFALNTIKLTTDLPV